MRTRPVIITVGKPIHETAVEPLGLIKAFGSLGGLYVP